MQGGTESMLVYRNESLEPGYNLALDEMLMYYPACVAGPVFGFWQNRPSVICGVHQCVEREVDAGYCRAEDIPVVRRCTGGGAVYHDLGNLNYSLFLPARMAGEETDYRICLDLLRPLFARLGVEIELSTTNDLLLEGKKFSGMACRKTHDVHLYHGTLLFDVDTERMAKALGNPEGKFVQERGVRSRHAEVINLKGWLSGIGTMSEFRSALESAMVEEYDLRELELEPDFLEEVRRSAAVRYRDLLQVGSSES